MKSVLVLSNLNPCRLGSFEELSLFVSRELRRREIRCFLGFTEYPTGIVKELFDATGATTVRIYCGETPIIGNTSKFKVRESFNFVKFLLKYRIDLIHLNFTGLTNPALMGMYLTPAKILFTEHASGVSIAASKTPLNCLKVGKQLLMKRISANIGVSEYVSRRIRDTVPISSHKIKTIYNGVNISRFQGVSKVEARKQLSLAEDLTYIATVAMLIPEKGIQILIESLGQLQKRGMNKIQLLIIGEGDYRGKLESAVEKLKLDQSVQFLGRRSDVHTIMAAADVVVTPSIWDEAFGLSIAEAMASARPVIASAVGGIPELIDSGENGLLVSPGNAQELADALFTILENPALAEEMGRRGREKAIHKFNLELQVTKLVDLYQEILA
jgi:glycosyltransferase involved in cell wall biosynthesis